MGFHLQEETPKSKGRNVEQERTPSSRQKDYASIREPEPHIKANNPLAMMYEKEMQVKTLESDLLKKQQQRDDVE